MREQGSGRRGERTYRSTKEDVSAFVRLLTITESPSGVGPSSALALHLHTSRDQACKVES